jgi:redox-sensitive bicupin YhaK (pirin superfamily)
VQHPDAKVVTPRPIKLTTRTGVEVQRLLPQAGLRKISAWCFLDHFGPTIADDAMVVAAHPHTGLQTATWLIDGAVEHRDSIGTVQTLLPGELNLMSAGRGIAHSELGVTPPEPRVETSALLTIAERRLLGESPAAIGANIMHAIQFWIALPDSVRHMVPKFEHHASLPRVAGRGFSAKVFIGEFHGVTSPATTYWPMVGAQIGIDGKESVIIPLKQEFEHGILALTGSLEVDGKHIAAGELIYLPAGDAGVTITAHRPGTQAVLIGGEPFNEQLVMWWNFIGRSHEEIVKARENWNARGSEDAAAVAASHEQFGATFTDSVGGWIPAPELPSVHLRSR